MALALALSISIVLWWLHPIASASAYALGVETTAALLVVWVVWAARPSLLRSRVVLLLVAVVGSMASAARAIGLDANAEVVRTYRSLFVALAQGRNPYTCQCIVHVTPRGDRLGDFNYPPAEIWPYRAVYAIVRHWDIATLALTVIGFSTVAFALLLFATPPGQRVRALAFFPLLVVWELRTTVAMTMVMTAAIVAVVLAAQRHERRWHRPALWILFGVGLLTKFALIPLFAVWWWTTTVSRAREARGASPADRRGALARAAADLFAPIAIALALCLSFGVASVVRSTLLFNVELDQRAQLTTFYPNVVSGLLSWIGLQRAFPIVAGTILAVAVLIAPRMRMLIAMLLATTVFLLVSPTPEPQYLPMVLLLFLGALAEREPPDPRPARGPRAPTPAGRGGVPYPLVDVGEGQAAQALGRLGLQGARSPPLGATVIQ